MIRFEIDDSKPYPGASDDEISLIFVSREDIDPSDGHIAIRHSTSEHVTLTELIAIYVKIGGYLVERNMNDGKRLSAP